MIFMKIVIFFLILLFPFNSFAEKNGNCPEGKEELCKKIKELGYHYQNILDQENFTQSDLSGPSYALALGYAHIGDEDKSQKFVAEMEKSTLSKNNFNTNISSVIRQFLLLGRYDDASYFFKGGSLNRDVCQVIVQVYAYQMKLQLLENALKEKGCSIDGISDVAEHVSRNDLIELYEKIIKDTSNQGFFKSRLIEKEKNKIFAAILDKSTENSQQLSVPDFIEEDALNNIETAKKLISFYAIHNDIQALELFTKFQYTARSESSIVPKQGNYIVPTEISYLIINQIKDQDDKFKLLMELLRSLAFKNPDLLFSNKHEHVSAQCSEKNLGQCIYDTMPTDKISEKDDLNIKVFLSDFDELKKLEKSYVSSDNTSNLLSITKDSNASYSKGGLIQKSSLWGIHRLISAKKDCNQYYQEDILNIKNNVSDKSVYIGDDPYFAIQCLVTRGEHKDILMRLSSAPDEFSWLNMAFRDSFYNYSLTDPTYERLAEEASFLSENLAKDIHKAIISFLLKEVDDPNLSQDQRVGIYDSIDRYLIKPDNYDPQLINLVFHEYFLDFQSKRAFTLVDSLPKFQKYIDDNYATSSLGNIINTLYKVPLGSNKDSNKARELSWEIMNIVKNNNPI